jgi:DNA-binding CsgD family transcriptional regulator
MASANALINLADAWRQLGDLPRAIEINQQALEITNRLGIKRLTALIKANLGQIASIEGNSGQAIGLLIEAIQGAWESQDLASLPEIFAIAAPESAAQGRADLGALLLGAGIGLRATLGHEMAPDEEATHLEIVTTLRAALGDAELERALAMGEAAPLKAVIEQVSNATALIELTPERQAEQALAERTGLNLRELTALRLFIADRSNTEIAAELDISLAMATALIGQLYTKVGASSRADLTAFAFKHGVV